MFCCPALMKQAKEARAASLEASVEPVHFSLLQARLVLVGCLSFRGGEFCRVFDALWNFALWLHPMPYMRIGDMG
jgi:hypothetical protein